MIPLTSNFNNCGTNRLRIQKLLLWLIIFVLQKWYLDHRAHILQREIAFTNVSEWGLFSAWELGMRWREASRTSRFGPHGEPHTKTCRKWTVVQSSDHIPLNFLAFLLWFGRTKVWLLGNLRPERWCGGISEMVKLVYCICMCGLVFSRVKGVSKENRVCSWEKIWFR